MGTTLTFLRELPRLYVVHVGDSRCYLLRRAELQQLTRDHTLAALQVECGYADKQDAEKSRLSHVLWNTLGGGSDELYPEISKAGLAVGDTVLLCTDGLSKHLSDEEIAAVLNGVTTAEHACRQLIDEANTAGGKDNVTAIVARFQPTSDQQLGSEVAATISAEECLSDTDRYEPTGEQRHGLAATADTKRTS